MPKARILVVDDEPNTRSALRALLRDDGYDVEVAADGFKALGKLTEVSPDLVLTDQQMPGMSGTELLTKIHALTQDVAVVLMTAFGDVRTAVAALKEGAADYLTKPLEVAELGAVITRELERLRLRREAGQLRERLAERYSFQNIVGSSAPMQAVFKIVAQVASSKASILISGESGTGKELIAAAIHERSPRAQGPFVKLHCAALAESLLESELFGHERGAFTGASARRDGRFAQAHKGTLFLDEIVEVSPAVQVKLLRFLQEHEFERVGGNETLRVDVRIITATNRDLKAAVATGLFREDLFYRLNVINVHIPPLRERPSDIPQLVSHFLRRFAEENGKAIEGVQEAALAALCAYHWPGNVRELENLVERAVVLCKGPCITLAELPPDLPLAYMAFERPGGEIRIPGSPLAEVERHVILKTLEAHGGSTSKAAQVLGISVRKIQYRLHEYHAAPKAGVSALADRTR